MTEDTREIKLAKIAVLVAIRNLMSLTGKVLQLSDVVDFARPVTRSPMEPPT